MRMATFKVCVRKQRNDGFYPVYIRVTHNRAIGYIKTGKLVNDAGLRQGEVTDPYVMKFCSNRIVAYVERLNKVWADHWTLKDVLEYIQQEDEDICFSDYARLHHDRMINNGQVRNARNYELAYQHLERYAGTTKVMFSHMTSAFVNAWIATLTKTHRAKEMYPVCIRQIFRAAIKEYNDYDTGIIRIKTNPWMKVKIPSADRPEHIAITPQACRAFFSAPLPESRYKSPLPELGRDVAMMILCLGGINTVDLYNLQKKDYYDGIIHYKRAKTRGSRRDEAYMEMRVPPILLPLVDKYLADGDDSCLFNFHNRHTTSDSFGANVNIGIKAICKSMGMEKEDFYCVYTFRHTWGTIAQNDCGASMDEVAFGMNHTSGHTVTRGYVVIDFTPAWELNEKVVDYVFFTDKDSHRQHHHEDVSFEKFSTKQMMRGTVYFKGKTLGEVQDIGFSNVNEIIAKLVPFIPDDVPMRSIVQFKIENCDKQQVVVYERQKGKGF